MNDAIGPPGLRLFISYSRRDADFADRLVDALKARGFAVRIDRRDLPKLEDWERELLGFIREADTVVFIVSPRSLASKVVGWEIDQVRAAGKRLAPVIIADVQGLDVPSAVARINYVDFTEPGRFEAATDELAHALNTDVAWLKEHTRIGEAARRWIEHGRPPEALPRGQDLADAEAWAARRPREAPPVTADQSAFLIAGREEETRAAIDRKRQLGLRRATLSALAVATLAGFGYAGWANRVVVGALLVRLSDPLLHPTLSTVQAKALKPGAIFQECADCPSMVAVPAGRFQMGAPTSEPGYKPTDGPPRPVAIAARFAISRYEVTFAQWDACVALGGCSYSPEDRGWGRGRQPVIEVSWADAQQYAAWLSRLTGRSYRLPSEAEWEYAARGGAATAYPWGQTVGAARADCANCGSRWDARQPAPVGAFPPNDFGVYDTSGNVWEWVQDCWHAAFDASAPRDGSAWTTACTDPGRHVVRGGSWEDPASDSRVAARYGGPTLIRNNVNGIRLVRDL